jgi:hypothetical protein
MTLALQIVSGRRFFAVAVVSQVDRQEHVALDERRRREVGLALVPDGHLVSMLQNLFPPSLTTRPNKLECFYLEILSSQVLEFESKARANPIGVPFRCLLLG